MDTLGTENPTSAALGAHDEETDLQRSVRIEALFDEIDARLDQVPRKPWPKDDPIVEKFRRMGILEED